MSKQPSDDEVMNWLLVALSQKGAGGFNVYFELEERYGRSFAENRLSFFIRLLEFYQVAKQDPSDKIFRLTGKGKLILKMGGWLSYLQIRAGARERDYLKRQAKIGEERQMQEVSSDESGAEASHRDYLKRQAKIEEEKQMQKVSSDDSGEDVEVEHNTSSGGQLLSGLALVVFIVAMVLAYLEFYN
jgi:hypothetical protein